MHLKIKSITLFVHVPVQYSSMVSSSIIFQVCLISTFRQLSYKKSSFLVPVVFVCLLGFIVPLKNFPLIWRSHHYRWRAANFDLCSALTAIEQWGFFRGPHLLWYRASVYNGHLQGPVILTPIRSGADSTCFYDLGLSRLGFQHPTFPLTL